MNTKPLKLHVVGKCFQTHRIKQFCAISGFIFAVSTVPNLAIALGSTTPNVGYGSQTQGGLSGQIIKVTNLNDSGAGSLRAAIAVSGPKVIVFEVGGRIWLNSDLKITTPYVTVAGETAPNPGITLSNAGLRIWHTHDVVVRHIRVRVGDHPSGPNPDIRDGIEIASNTGAPPVYNVVIDHCSVSWAIDENVSTWSNVRDVTVRYSIISEALSNATHPKGEHSKGFLISDHGKKVSMIGNLLAHNYDRNPLLSGDNTSVIVNNIIYNAGFYGVSFYDYYGNTGPILSDVIGNIYRPGPNTLSGSPFVLVEKVQNGSKLYMSDNRSESGRLYRSNSIDPRTLNRTMPDYLWTPLSVNSVENFVFSNAGARPKYRDAVDTRIVNHVKSRTGQKINSQKDVGGWPNYKNTYRQLSLPANPQGDSDGDGISNLQEWLDKYLTAVEGS